MSSFFNIDPIEPDLRQQMNILSIIGASGTGKTFLTTRFHEEHPDIPFYRFDTIGVPSTEEMIAKYGSGEAWQQAKTSEWITKIARDHAGDHWVLFEGQTRPQFVFDAYAKCGLSTSRIVCLWRDSETMRHRLMVLRNQPCLFTPDMVNWCNHLRRWTEELHDGVIVDTSSPNIEPNLLAFTSALEHIMMGSIRNDKEHQAPGSVCESA